MCVCVCVCPCVCVCACVCVCLCVCVCACVWGCQGAWPNVHFDLVCVRECSSRRYTFPFFFSSNSTQRKSAKKLAPTPTSPIPTPPPSFLTPSLSPSPPSPSTLPTPPFPPLPPASPFLRDALPLFPPITISEKKLERAFGHLSPMET